MVTALGLRLDSPRLLPGGIAEVRLHRRQRATDTAGDPPVETPSKSRVMACESDRSTALRNRICSFAGPAARSSNADKRRLKSLAMVNDDRTPRHAAAVDAESWSIPWTYDVRWWTSRPKINSRRHGRRPRPRGSRRRRQRLMPAESCGTSWGRGTRTDEQVAQDRDRILRNVVIAFVFRDRFSARSPWRRTSRPADDRGRAPATRSDRPRERAAR